MKENNSRLDEIGGLGMIRRIKSRPAAVLLAAIGSAAASYVIWDRVFLAFQHWYFHKYVQPIDPDTSFLPFAWESLWLLPSLSAVTAGVLTGALFGRGSRWLSLLVGFSLGMLCFGGLFEFYSSGPVTITSVGVAVLSSTAYYLVQLRAKAQEP